jgi:poly-D-alanine transfer protein DltD
VALPILRVHQNLELFKRHGFPCRRFPFLLESRTSAFGFLEETMNFDEVIQLQVLKLKALTHGVNNGRLVDHLIEQNETPELRQMCAKVHPSLIDRLDQVTNLLDMSKREFIEAAVSDALARAEEAIERSGALDQGSL